MRAQQAADLHQFLVQSGIALAIMAAVALALGWLTAGRTLRPLRVITAATRQISDRNLHERLALAGPRDELTDLAGTIDGLLARLDAAFGSQRRFVANASHELRTPLMLTQTLLQVALADPAITLGSLRGACQEVLATCKEQDRLIQALLTLARSQRGLDHRQPLDLAEISRPVLHARQREAPIRDLHVDAALDPAPAAGDPGGDPDLQPPGQRHPAQRPRRAHPDHDRHTRQPGHAHDSQHRPARARGPGPAAAGALPASGRKRGHDHEGLGLGLSIVAAIADAHEATLSVRPRPSGGLVIEVAFCRAADSCWPHSQEAEAGPAVTRTSDRVTGVISGPPR
jgi:signal transduction histidine kinase